MREYIDMKQVHFLNSALDFISSLINEKGGKINSNKI